MPLTLPKIDDRKYRDILNEALARIPVHNPEWTNFNDSDPGVTLLQLFAFMSESLLYRSNLIPERNRIKFLQLLGIPLQPAMPAHCMITFSNPKGPNEAITLPKGIEVSAGKVTFRTKKGLDVLPIEAKIYYKRQISEEELSESQRENLLRLYAGLFEEGVEKPLYYETIPMPVPTSNARLPSLNLANTMDGSLWIALLARSSQYIDITRNKIANKTLSLGIFPDLTVTPRVLRPGNLVDEEKQCNLRFLIPKKVNSEGEKEPVAEYRELEAIQEPTILEKPGIVELKLPDADQIELWQDYEPLVAGSGDFPPTIDDTNIENRLVTWIRIQIPGVQIGQKLPSNLHVRLSWIGINAVPASQGAHVPAEIVGKGSGEPNQVFHLTNIPLITDSIYLTVGGEPWQMIDDLFAADSEELEQEIKDAVSRQGKEAEKVRVFQLDAESGQIRFGNGLHGKRPPKDAVIQASYDYGGGREGMVGIGTINKSTMLPAYIKCNNEIPAWDGSDAQTVSNAEIQIPQYLRHRDRLVSKEDFVSLVQQTPGVEIGRAEILTLYDPQTPEVSTPGAVTIMVIPKHDRLNPDAPKPDQLFLGAICDYLDPRRLVTTEIHVQGPEYVAIGVSIGIEIVAGQTFATVREAVKKRIRTFSFNRRTIK